MQTCSVIRFEDEEDCELSESRNKSVCFLQPKSSVLPGAVIVQKLTIENFEKTSLFDLLNF